MFVQNYHGRYRIEFRRFRLHFSASALLLLIMVLCSCQTTYPEYQTYYPPKPPNATSDPVQKDPAENRSETVNPRAGTSAAHQVMDMRTYRAALAEGQQLGRPGTPGENMNPATPTVTAAVPKPPATHPGVRSSIKTGANRPENPQDRQNYYDIYDPANPYANKDGYVRVVAGAIYHPYKGNGVTAPKGQAITPIENPTVNPGGATASLPPQQRPPASRSTQAYPDLPTVTDVSVYNAVSSPEPLSDRRIPANITTLSGTNSISQTGSMPAMEPTASLPDVMVVPDRRPQPASFVEPIVSRQETGSRPKAPSLDGAIEYLEKLLEVNPQDVDARMALRLLYSAYGDSKNAFRDDALPPGQDPAEMSCLTQAVVRSSMYWRDKKNPLYANTALSALNQLSQQISKNADMTISCVKICSSIDGFGKYQEIPKDQLEYHQGQVVHVYCELKNVKHQMDAQGKYFTRLHATIALRDENYSDLITPLSEDVEDAPIFNKRQDFFLRGSIKLPKLSAGRYDILVSMEDQVAGKNARPVHFEFDVKGGTRKAVAVEKP